MYEDDKLVTVNEMRRYLHCGREQLYKILQRPLCPKKKINNRIFLPFYAFLTWYDTLKKHTKQSASEQYYYVYRLLDKNNNILYVGKSKRLKQRISQHLGKGSNLDPECVDRIAKVQYLIFTNECDMCLYEIYLINLYQPQYNIDTNSGVGTISLPVPKQWNEFDVNNLRQSKIEDVFETIKPDFNFDYNIFSDKSLTDFINTHAQCFLNNNELNELSKLCKMSTLDLSKINDYIVFNNPRAEIKIKNDMYFLDINPNGRHGYGGFSKHKDGFVFSIKIGSKRKRIYGKDKQELAEKNKTIYKWQFCFI